MTKLNKGLKILILAAITCLLGGYLYSAADAQRGPEQRGGPQGFDPEAMEKLWNTQAAAVSAAVGLDEEASKKLAEVYLKARNDLQEKMAEARQSGAGREGWREMREETVEGLHSSLDSILSAEQAAKAKEYLGGFSFRSDIGAGVLSRLLEDDTAKIHQSVAIVMKHETANPPGPRSGGGGPPDPEAREERRQTLLKELGSILSDEQLEEFEQAYLQWGRGGRGGPGGRGPQ